MNKGKRTWILLQIHGFVSALSFCGYGSGLHVTWSGDYSFPLAVIIFLCNCIFHWFLEKERQIFAVFSRLFSLQNFGLLRKPGSDPDSECRSRSRFNGSMNKDSMRFRNWNPIRALSDILWLTLPNRKNNWYRWLRVKKWEPGAESGFLTGSRFGSAIKF